MKKMIRCLDNLHVLVMSGSYIAVMEIITTHIHKDTIVNKIVMVKHSLST